MLRIAVIGTGDVGFTLAKGWASKGYSVTIGTRDPTSEKVQKLVADIGFGVTALEGGEAALSAEVIVFAVNGGAAAAAIESIGADKIGEKIVIDAMNPITYDPATGLHLSMGVTDSLGETVQRLLPAAKVVKALNTVGYGLFVDPPSYNGLPGDMFICGNDTGAKEVVTGLVQAIGWASVVDVGGIIESRYLESLALMWIRFSMAKQMRTHAFKLLM